MSDASCDSAVLPLLRPDIEFHPGPDEPDGSPTYVIYDPLQRTFDKATWVQAQILGLLRTPLTIDRLLKQLASYTTIRVSGDDVHRLCADACGKGLTRDSCVSSMRAWEARQVPSGFGLLETLLRKLLYFRIPLVNPDVFLSRTLGIARCLATPGAFVVYASVAMIGVLLLAQRFDAYVSTFPYFFNLRGAALFAATLIAVKTVHELSHAYVAKALGSRVPVMGVALILLFPVMYSDVTDSWRVRSRRKRLLIGLAGVVAEGVIAGLALFVWAMSPSGPCKSICFAVSSVTLISTLLVNLNPAMRFDGYYVLSDLLGIDNLQSRSVAATRWVIRRYLLGLAVEPPEAGLPPRRLVVMTTYSVFASLYRLLVYFGISLMLYHRFTKVVGGALFLASLFTLVLRPLGNELVGLITLQRARGWNPRIMIAAIGSGLLFLWMALPLPHRRSLPAITVPRDSQVIYTPSSGVVRALIVELGSRVSRGQTLFVIESEELRTEAELARLEVERIGLELTIIRSDERRRALLPQKTEELARATATLDSLRAALEGTRIMAEIDGVVADWDERVRDGMPIRANEVVGKVVDDGLPRVACYVKHDVVSNISIDDQVYFIPKARPGRLWGIVTNIEPTRATFLEHDSLASTSGGDIAVAPDALGRLEVVESYYRAEITLEGVTNGLRLGQTGTVWMRTAPRSHLLDLGRYIYRILVRESSL